MATRKQIEPICSRIEPIWTHTRIYSHERTKHENIPCKKGGICFRIDHKMVKNTKHENIPCKKGGICFRIDHKMVKKYKNFLVSLTVI